MANKRADRVAKLLRQVISETIAFKLKHPDIRNVTVSRVRVSDNIRHVKVYVSIQGTPEEKKTVFAALESSRGFIKQQMGQEVTLRFMPELQFVLDDSLDYAENIEQLLRSLKKKPE